MAKIHIAEEEHAVLFTGYDTGEVRRLGIDAQNCAVLDSACSNTVCSDKWINNYIQSLDNNDKLKVKQNDGQRVFKFGGGTCLKSKGEYIMTEIEEKCELCKVYAKTPSRPVVGMPMAKKFNKKVVMDLKRWNGCWILHIIDMWSRYTVSIYIDRKKSSCIIDALMTHWIGTFGIMGALMTDNGGEFSSDEMREITSILNAQLCTTSG